MNDVFGEEPMKVEEKKENVLYVTQDEKSGIVYTNKSTVIVPVTTMETFTVTNKVPVTEILIKNFTRPIPVTQVVTFTEKVPVTEIIPVTETEASTTSTTPTTTFLYTKKVPVTEFQVYQETSKVPVTEVIVKNFTRPVPVTEVVTYTKIVPVTKIVNVTSTASPSTSAVIFTKIVNLSTASPLATIIPVKACRPTVCFGKDDCGSYGRCVGVFPGTCNCAACINAIDCIDDANCGGLKGSCDLASHRCNCIKGYAMNGFPTLTAAIQQFCHKKHCTSFTDRQDCFGLPCSMGRCVCH